MPRLSWAAKRNHQGYSYDEVQTELKRRRDADRVRGSREAQILYERALAEIQKRYRLSATICDVLDREGMTYRDLIALLGTNDDDAAIAVMVDPFGVPPGAGRAQQQEALRADVTIDVLYPRV